MFGNSIVSGILLVNLCHVVLYHLITMMNIYIFLVGFATALFGVFAIHILFWRRARTRFQTVVGIIMAIWAVWCAKDLILTFPGMYREDVLSWIMMIDGWSALTYMVLVVEVVKPGWTTWKRILLLFIPFAIFTVVYAALPRMEVIYAYSVFLWVFAWTVVGVGYVKMRRSMKYMRMEFSEIEKIDASWLRYVFIFSIVGQLAWLFTSLYAQVWADIIYYIVIILLWLLVLYYSWNFQPKGVNAEEMALIEDDLPKNEHAINVPPIDKNVFENVVEREKIYLHPDLTLQELASALGTNRTYVSNYISQVIGMSFYDYINSLRIERSALPLIDEHPEFTFEYVARQSGFASMSTFRRAFAKHAGMTPRQYVENKRNY